MRPHEDRDPNNALTDIAAVQRYTGFIEIVVAALAVAMAAGLLVYAGIGV